RGTAPTPRPFSPSRVGSARVRAARRTAADVFFHEQADPAEKEANEEEEGEDDPAAGRGAPLDARGALVVAKGARPNTWGRPDHRWLAPLRPREPWRIRSVVARRRL